MSFAWYNPDVPLEYRSTGPKASAMYEREIQERAALLMRLGYSQEEAIQRIRGNVLWDFELHQRPVHLDCVTTLVSRIYSTGRADQGGLPSI